MDTHFVSFVSESSGHPPIPNHGEGNSGHPSISGSSLDIQCVPGNFVGVQSFGPGGAICGCPVFVVVLGRRLQYSFAVRAGGFVAGEDWV